jgi:cell division topological specificity factor
MAMSVFRQWLKPPAAGSSNAARDRLKLVLVHNRLEMSAEMVGNLRRDLLTILSRYFDVDQDSFVLDVQRGKSNSQLVTSISLKRKK